MATTKSPLADVVRLLSHEAPDRRIAAAIVLGELGVKAADAVAGLRAMVDEGSPPLQRPALDALARIGAPKALPSLVAALASRDAEVRAAAIAAIVACGDEVVPFVRDRLAATQGEERRALDAVLARFGGRKEAAVALLDELEHAEPETARTIAAKVRPEIAEADAKTRSMWLSESKRVIAKLSKRQPLPAVALSTALKILGYVDDPRALEVLLPYAKDRSVPHSVRLEALIALRFAGKDGKRMDEVVEAYVDAAEAPDRLLSQAALLGLVALEVGPSHARAFARLGRHPDFERARLAIEKLSRIPGAEATRALVDLLATQDRKRQDLATEALGRRDDALSTLVDALVDTHDSFHANALRLALRPRIGALKPAARKKLVAAALERIAAGAPHAAHADVAREADPKGFDAGLRELSDKLRKSKKTERHEAVLRLLAHGELATDDDRYRLAAALLEKSPRSTLPSAGAEDEALALLAKLSDAGFDVATALAKDRRFDAEHLYYAGFHLVEEGSPLGEELLAAVVKDAGRTKLGKMAKNKLELARRAGSG